MRSDVHTSDDYQQIAHHRGFALVVQVDDVVFRQAPQKKRRRLVEVTEQTAPASCEALR